MKIIALIIGFIVIYIIYLLFRQEESWKDKLMVWALNNGLNPNSNLKNLPSFSGIVDGYMCVIEIYPLGFGPELPYLNTRVDVFVDNASNQLITKIWNDDKIPRDEISYLDKNHFNSLLNVFDTIKLNRDNLVQSGASLRFFSDKISFFINRAETNTEHLDSVLTKLILLARQIEHINKFTNPQR